MEKKKTFEDILKLTMGTGDLPVPEPDRKTDPETTARRIRSLERCLFEIRRRVSGERASFLPFVEDGKGRLSHRKMNAFIKELIDSHPAADTFTKDKRELLELFFYCVIAGPSGTRSDVYREILSPAYACSYAFAEFIKAAGDPVFSENDRMKLVQNEEYDRAYIEYGSGFSFFMNLLMDASVERSFYTQEELREAAEVYADARMEDPEAVWALWNGIEKQDDGNNRQTASRTITVEIPAGYELSDEEPVTLPEPDWDYIESERDRLMNEAAEQNRKYLDHLPAKEHLQESYIKLRKMLYQIDHSDMEALVKEMVSAFILSHDLAPVCYDSIFEKITECLTDTSNRIQTYTDAADRK